MSSENGWGGKRNGAGSGGSRPGAGRPQRKWDSRGKGAAWVMERSERPGAFPEKPRMWRVLSVSADEIEFQDIESEAIIVLRLPDDAKPTE